MRSLGVIYKVIYNYSSNNFSQLGSFIKLVYKFAVNHIT